MMNAVFAMQGFGNLAAAIVALCVTSGFKSVLLKYPDHHHVDYMWRIIIGLGIVPACIALYYRLTIPETPRYTMDIERDLNQAEKDADFVKTGRFEKIEDQPVERIEMPKASRRDFVRHYSKWSNLKVLLGCAYSWFALDIAFYGLGTCFRYECEVGGNADSLTTGLNSSIILTAIGFGSSKATNANQKVYDNLFNTALGNIMCVPFPSPF